MSYQADRGKHPEDARLFSAEAIEKLKLAAEEMAWLTGRDYAPSIVNELVGTHHKLDLRQRTALLRGTCSEPQYRRRAARESELEDVAKRPITVDALNVVIVAETALAGGLLLQTIDGTVCGISSGEAAYEDGPETPKAIDLVLDVLKEARPSLATLYFDEAVDGAPRARDMWVDRAKSKKLKMEATLGPHAALHKAKCIATSDPALLDRCASWFNLTGRVASRVPGAWIVRLQ